MSENPYSISLLIIVGFFVPRPMLGISILSVIGIPALLSESDISPPQYRRNPCIAADVGHLPPHYCRLLCIAANVGRLYSQCRRYPCINCQSSDISLLGIVGIPVSRSVSSVCFLSIASNTVSQSHFPSHCRRHSRFVESVGYLHS